MCFLSLLKQVAAQLWEHSTVALRQERFCSPKITGQCWGMFWLSQGGERGCYGLYQAEAKGAAGYPKVLRTPPLWKMYPALNVKSTEVERNPAILDNSGWSRKVRCDMSQAMWTHLKPLLTSHLLEFCWPKQVPWPSPKSLGSGHLVFQFSWRHFKKHGSDSLSRAQRLLSTTAMLPLLNAETEAQKDIVIFSRSPG